MKKPKSGELDIYAVISQWIASQKPAPYTIRTRTFGIKNFLLLNDVPIDNNKFKVKVKQPKSITFLKLPEHASSGIRKGLRR